ncbi:ExeM/NucH family extracellular endonuclease [Deinococcus maricopensis]|uniref:Endonuclease/exonuclease/phosphatase n=1 Tax=Deinococcus maricopensis (strain DSM 21211 / LMG 22137 / NRRL B-23946 / LB-34) TaxID=709986 RepID=E8U979_DEIML|nr:ExeM/NucH family extracellular endonuclease [Deinococcus maricopensis]ADV67618.1 Endonuclease/exonuclease/phosphatase [Deinococcus maricopensis DSM 21211]
MTRKALPLMALLALAACSQPTTQRPQPAPAQPASAGVYEVSFLNAFSKNADTRVTALPTASLRGQTLGNVSGALNFSKLSVDTFTVESTGKRYVRATYRVTNNTGRAIENLTFVPLNTDDTDGDASNNATTPTVGATAFKDVRYYDGSDASARATALTPTRAQTYDPNTNSVSNDASATPYLTGLDTSALTPDAPAGLSANFVAPAGWRASTFLAPGASSVVTFAVSLDMAQTPAGDPFAFSVVVTAADEPQPITLTAIHAAQGATPNGDAATPLNGQAVTVQGVVTGNYSGAGKLNGFYIQAPDADADADPTTSEGLFVYCGGTSTCTDVNVGDLVRVSGTLAEFGGGTQLGTVTRLDVMATNQPLPAPVDVTLPVATTGTWERYEGMRLRFPGTLTVTDNYGYGRYGQLGLSSGGRLYNPTNGNDASTADLNTRRKIILDDGVSSQNPGTLAYLSDQNTRRTGSTTADLAGIWAQNSGGYMLEPTGLVAFTDANPRQDSPNDVGQNATVRVAGANVLNYFTALVNSNTGCTTDGVDANARGANNCGEFLRQQAKVVAALKGLNADVVTLMEVQNNGDKALANLTDALNAAVGAGTYDYIHTGTIGTDAIHVAMIYKPANVTPVGAYRIDNNNVYSRPPLAQTFKDNHGGVFTVVANHLKSKGSCPTSGDIDNGQGCWNTLRVQQAQALLNFVDTLKTATGDQDVLLMGDFNAYGNEDPINTIVAGGFESLNKRIPAEDRYSYQFGSLFGYLDHALATNTLAGQVTGITEWHINSDEPTVADYNVEFKNVPGCTSASCTGLDLYGPGPFRASDHDPVLVGLNLTPTNALGVNATGAGTATTGQPYTLTISSTGTPTALSVDWGDGTTEPVAANATSASHAYASAGARTITVTATRGTETQTATQNVTVGDATVTLTAPATAAVTIGSGTTLSATLSAAYNLGSVTVTAATAQSGLSATVTPATAGNGTTALSVNVSADSAVPAGTYPITLTATGTGVSDSKTVNVTVSAAQAGVGRLVISQVYGGGGNNGAQYKNDFIELFNAGSGPISTQGLSLQYAGPTGAFGTANVFALPALTVQPGRYVLVQLAAGTGGTVDLPTPDATGALALGGTNGKVALASSTAAISGKSDASVLDFVGYGSANEFEGTAGVSALSNSTGAQRKNAGCTDTNQNSTDFSVAAPTPRNSSTDANLCP